LNGKALIITGSTGIGTAVRLAAARGARVDSAPVSTASSKPEISSCVAMMELQEFLRKKQPLTGGAIEAEDVARAATFLLSSESRAITGQVLAVDGAWRLTGA
jgi:enoyl-[acyl-carrier-protein] reductase (NADH)